MKVAAAESAVIGTAKARGLPAPSRQVSCYGRVDLKYAIQSSTSGVMRRMPFEKSSLAEHVEHVCVLAMPTTTSLPPAHIVGARRPNRNGRRSGRTQSSSARSSRRRRPN